VATALNIEHIEGLFSEFLEQNGHRKTPERFAILNEVYTLEGHFDIDMLYANMQHKEFRVSRATLYNTIDLLLTCDLVRKHQFGKNLAQFEKAHAFKQHDHLICSSCNKVMEFCDPRIQNIRSKVAEVLEFEVHHHSLNIYGRCKDCRRGEHKNKSVQ